MVHSQVFVLSEELCSVRAERDALRAAQSSATAEEDQTSESADPLLKIERDLVEAQLKEAELTRQLTETSEQLQNIQTEKHTLLAALEEATQKVRALYTTHTPTNHQTECLTLFYPVSRCS